ncbi:hypothetical protein YC2023_034337 [Brassica napus]
MNLTNPRTILSRINPNNIVTVEEAKFVDEFVTLKVGETKGHKKQISEGRHKPHKDDENRSKHMHATNLEKKTK